MNNTNEPTKTEQLQQELKRAQATYDLSNVSDQKQAEQSLYRLTQARARLDFAPVEWSKEQ